MLDIIQYLEYKPKQFRFDYIISKLIEYGVEYYIHEYDTGKNIIVDIGNNKNKIGISSHYDTVEDCPGANDNLSSVLVCLDIIRKFKDSNHPLRIFFFDEEEHLLNGSREYINTHDISDLYCLLNMELVGMGEQILVWNVDVIEDKFVQNFIKSISNTGIAIHTTNDIVTNVADHVSFKNSGLQNCFTITSVTEKDISIFDEYSQNLFNLNINLFDILKKSSIFEVYHTENDTSDKLDQNSLTMISTVLETYIKALPYEKQ